MLGSQLENQGTWFSAQVWDSLIIDGISSEDRLENGDGSHLIPKNHPTLE
jgi:hypothetical protein